MSLSVSQSIEERVKSQTELLGDEAQSHAQKVGKGLTKILSDIVHTIRDDSVSSSDEV